MKADLRLLAIITVIGISHGQTPVERGDVDNDLSDHVSEITTTPQWHTFSPDVLLDRKLADGVYIDPEKFEASIHVTLDGVYCIEKINLYFKRQTDESFDFTFNGFGFFGNGHPPDGSQLGVTVELESAESELYKECESGKLSDTFSILRDGKSETFYLMELVPVGVKAELLNEGGDGGDEGGDDKEEDESGDEGGNQKYSSTINKVADVALIVGLLAGLEI